MPLNFPFPSSRRGSGRGGFPFPLPQRRPNLSRQGTARRPMFGGGGGGGGGRGGGSTIKVRLLIALAVALFAVVSYYGKPGDLNEVTGERERVAMTEEADEIQLGLQAAPQMAQQHGGVSRSMVDRQRVQQVGFRLLEALEQDLRAGGRRNPYLEHFRFTLLADPQTVNAFALPGGQVFITDALYSQLTTEGQLAGVLGHEIGHVLARHGNKRMAKQKFFQGLAGAAGVFGGDARSAQMAQMVTNVLSMKYGRQHELESDLWGVRLCRLAGYDPSAMLQVMDVLDRASGGKSQPEFFSTHPKPANRKEFIEKAIQEEFPNGIPPGLRP